MIFEANLLLDNIDKTEGLSEERYAYHAGQAHFALGFGYFMLSRAYGQAVITDNAKDLKTYGLLYAAAGRRRRYRACPQGLRAPAYLRQAPHDFW